MESRTPFDAEAATYDDTFTSSTIGRLARERFWRYADPLLAPGSRVLELGGGTGEDACHFAQRGVRVVYSDASEGMLRVAQEKVRFARLEECVDLCQLDMARLGEPGYATNALGTELFDGAYANFGAINCVENLPRFAKSLAGLLCPGAPVMLTVMGPCVPWEWAWFLSSAHFSKAFRRLKRRGISWRGMTINYPSATALAGAFSSHFTMKHVGVVNAFLPPSYVEGGGLSRAFLNRCDDLDERFKESRFLARFADHFLAHLIRN